MLPCVIIMILRIACAILYGAFALAAQTTGPPHGSLLIIGGGAFREPAILERFLRLAGGPDAPLVIIPTASTEVAGYEREFERPFREAGATDVTVLHTRDRKVADSVEFVQPLLRARAVYFSGGRQWRIADAYLNTRVQRELDALLERGGVIAGSSAGATIQGSYLVRGDTKTNTVMMGDHEEGFGFLRNSAIDQHLLRRNRHFDLIEVVRAHPELLGFGIDEGTALLVTGNQAEVIGKSYVAVYEADKLDSPAGRFFFLAPGDRFRLDTREAFRPVETLRPLDVVTDQPWLK